jgi:hypothetical protein
MKKFVFVNKNYKIKFAKNNIYDNIIMISY